VSGGEHYLASVDGELMDAAEATIPVTDEGLVRGDGVFEVIRVYDGLPFALEEHLARLERSARNIRLPVDLEAVRTDVHRLLARAVADPRQDHEELRIMLTRGGRRIVMTEPMHVVPDQIRLITIAYQPTLILDGIKSLSYAANRLASRLAQEQGYDEALLVTPEGLVLEAPTSTLFWVKDGQLRTPPLSDHILASITRGIVMQVTDAVEYTTTLSDLLGADEAFLASTIREVQPIAQINDVELTAPGPVSEQTAATVNAHMAEVLKPA
jgi:branched-chain amino acid aminotransferase